MAVQFQEVRVTADLTIHVPRDAAGDLADGVETMLERVEAVLAVGATDVTGLTPRLNDLQADVTVRVTLALDRPDVEAAREALDDGFGVRTEGVRIDEPPP